MPELPEVETVRLGLLPVMEGKTIVYAETRRGDLRVPFPNDFAGRLTGRRVKRLWRRAKYILGDLDDGETLVIHLGMSGRMSVHVGGTARKLGNYVHDMGDPTVGTHKHDHVVFDTDAPARIVFNDHRRFGLMLLVGTDELDEHKLFAGLGVEPLSKDFNASYLAKALNGKKTPIKSALLDQRVIAGLGNIYVCEALFRARISPKRQAAKVRPGQIKLLTSAIKAVLEQAVKAGGSSLRDHKRTDGELGMFQHSFQVYGRTGKPCPAKDCNGTIKRIVQAGRSTWYCPSCQK
ncbi:MAG: bifunctional DNA-formamidopyrimidine glycosylase/DNA-(apurinic or apyrimidinic site) lyase [Alphaproteobacteria bacterium]|nr:bifunctional DNA-formamidopyrimidine glycosylase/DNA-(apurinic or apyrimidinic site) lyase [Alphaproteobacteria bacterium]MBV9541243.1 bifunctional DNA-formamidopyrimidine glycosylase/DNA-(apurinic or apyrimidinic site) lyase [Alphaproteobacteria bacterium]MBV9905370.1 bifunctional DNA-formamidopyrimidine glycosylase/DNA-(apurinic or apyrimidinic site) lyase [Alphaproteobacteria bacterium]